MDIELLLYDGTVPALLRQVWSVILHTEEPDVAIEHWLIIRFLGIQDQPNASFSVSQD